MDIESPAHPEPRDSGVNGASPQVKPNGTAPLSVAEKRRVAAAVRAMNAKVRAQESGGGESEIANDEPAQSDPQHDDAFGLLRLYHRAAEGVNGVLMLGAVNPAEENPEAKKKAPYRTQRFKIGDVDGMAREAAGRAGSANVYFAPAVIRGDLKKGARGTKEDIVAVLGFAADDDHDNGKPAVMPPIEPSVIVQTCEKPTINRQPHWVLSRPLTLEEAKPIADLMKRKVGGDSGTGDLAHVWRSPSTLNHPNKAKLDRGRPKEPQPVKLIGGTMRLVDPDEFRRALESMPDLAPAKTKGKEKPKSNGANGHTAEKAAPTGDAAELIKKLKLKLRNAIATERTGDRSKHSFSVMCQLFGQGFSDPEVLTIAHGAPFARKFSDRGDLETEIARVRVVWEARKETAATESRSVLDQMNDEFAVVKVGSKVRVMTLEERRGALIPSYMTLPDFKVFEDKYRIDTINENTDDLKKTGRGTWWLKHHARRQFKAVVFEPGTSEEETLGKFNLWRGFAVKPIDGDCSLYLSHVTDIICSGNDEHATYMLDLMAYCVQHPGVRPEVAPVLKGLEGTGKGTMVHPYGRLFGPHYLQVSQPSHVIGHFNAHLQQTRVLFADEALFAGDPKIVGIFKALITEPENLIEPKGVDSFPAPNRLFIIMASNNDWVIPAGPDARRFFVLNVSDARKQDYSYFEKVNKQMESGGMEALLYFLQNRDLTNFNVRNVPKTEALADQKARSRRGVDALVEHLCDEGRLPCAHGAHFNVAITSGEEKGEGFWPAARKLVPSLKHDSSRVIGKTLKETWGCKFYEANGVRGLRFPILADLRAKFDARHGKQEWGPIETWGALMDGGENEGD